MKDQRQGGFLIAQIHQRAGRIFTKKLKEHKIEEINPAQGRILFPLWQKDGLSIQELSQRTSLGKSTLTSMLDRLEADGFVMRVSSKEDRRKILIYLTEKDLAMRKAYDRVSDEMIELFYQGFTEDEKNIFESHLQRILQNLEQYESGGGGAK